MQASLESEQRSKAEALRIKKKLEGDINELEIALDHANKANSEAQKSIKRYQGQLRESECAYEEESHMRQEMSEKASLADRRAAALQGEMEEARSLLDSAERGKRQIEGELAESRNAVNEMNTINSKASAEKRHIEGLCTLCMLRLMTCSSRLRTVKRRPRRQWLMQPVWLMSSVLSRIMLTLSPRLRDPLRLSFLSLRTGLLKLMRR